MPFGAQSVQAGSRYVPTPLSACLKLTVFYPRAQYGAKSMPSLVRHCASTHYTSPAGKVLSKRKQKPAVPVPSAKIARTEGAAAPPANKSVEGPTKLIAAPSPTRPSEGKKLALQNSAAVVRKRGYRLVPIPATVDAVASRAQELLFRTTGLLFCDAAFQVPRSEDEALSVIRGAIADFDRSSQNGKLFYLSWAHSQFFQAEMAAIGYRFVAARVRNAAGATGPPPVSSWLSLRLLTRAAAAAAQRKRKMRAMSDTGAAADGGDLVKAVTGQGTGLAEKTRVAVVRKAPPGSPFVSRVPVKRRRVIDIV